MPADVALSSKQFEIAIQALTLSMLKLPSDAFDQVRVGWQPLGQPFAPPDVDVCYVRASTVDDPYNRIRDFVLANASDSTIQVTVTYTRVWEVYWTFYGPNGLDRGRLVRSGLFYQDSHDALAASNVYLISDVAETGRVPEVQDGQWWERTDLKARFNEAVTEYVTVPSVASVEVLLNTKDGVLADFTVSVND